MTDLSKVSTKELVAEAQRRAPTCPKGCGVPMFVKPNWYYCPVCDFTVDYE